MSTNPVRKHYSKTIKDFYKEYKKLQKSKGIPVSEIISYSEYRDFFRDVFAMLSRSVIEGRRVLYLPYSLGSIMVKAGKTNLNNPDYHKVDYHQSKKLKKRIIHVNDHTFGWYYMIKWIITHVRFKNMAYYKFDAPRSKYATQNGVGKIALGKHLKDISTDPNKQSYHKL